MTIVQQIENVFKKYLLKKGNKIKVVLGNFDFDDDTPNNDTLCNEDVDNLNQGIYQGITFDGDEDEASRSDYYIKILTDYKTKYYAIDNIKKICLERNIDNNKRFVSYKKNHLKLFK